MTDLPQANEGSSVYNLVVYIKRFKDGSYQARAANLALDPVVAGDTRSALESLVVSAKSWLRSAQQSPWLETPAEPDAGEQKLLLPLHL